MKKILAIAMALVLTMSFASCTGDGADTTANTPDTTAATEAVTDAATDADTAEGTTAPAEAPAVEGTTYEQFVALEDQAEVTVITYVQNKQSWWDNKGTFYTQNGDGGYFLYEMACSEDEYNKLVPGTKIKVTGHKTAWSGELEIIDATYEILEGETYIAPATDVTALLGTEDLAKEMNKLGAFKGMTIEASKNSNDEDVAFTYKNDTQGEDIYFKASVNGKTYDFCVESYLTGKDTDVYKAVEALKVGDKVDIEGFLYWYNEVNPHVVSVKAAA